MGAGRVIAHVDTESGFSGGEVQVFLLMEGLAARGHRNVLFCRPGSRCEEEARSRGLPTRAVSMRNDLHLASVPRLRRGFADVGAELVHLHTGRAHWLGGLAARLAGLPAVATRRMDRPVRRGVWTRILYGSLVRRAVAISPAVARLLAAGGVPDGMVRTIPSSVDPGALVPRVPRDEVRAREGVDGGTALLLAAARLSRRKGFDVLLEALAELRARGVHFAPRLWIAGDGDERPALEALSARRGLDDRVRFLGRREDVPDLLGACDALVMPSRAEGLGIAALQAMAAGRPVVASAVGGLADAVVHEETGLLVPPDDAGALADALARLGDVALRRRLGDAGPPRVRRHFSADAMVEAYAALYEEVIAEAVAGAAR